MLKTSILSATLLSSLVSLAFASTSGNTDKQPVPSLSVKTHKPIASSLEARRFREAVDDGVLGRAQHVLKLGTDELRSYCGQYLVSLPVDKLVGFVCTPRKGLDKYWLVGMICVHADQPLLDTVFEELESSDNFTLSDSFLEYVAGSPAIVASKPERLAYVLNKLSTGESQGDATRFAVDEMIEGNKFDAFDSLLSTIEQGTFENQDLRSVAIGAAFWKASEYGDDRALPAKFFFDHPAVSSKNYSLALYRSYGIEDQNQELFNWLLEAADREDLGAAMKDDRFSTDSSAKFQQAVKGALQKVGFDTRHGITRRKGVPAIKDALDHSLPKVLIDLITGYYLLW